MAGSDVTICGFGFEWVNPGGGGEKQLPPIICQ